MRDGWRWNVVGSAAERHSRTEPDGCSTEDVLGYDIPSTIEFLRKIELLFPLV